MKILLTVDGSAFSLRAVEYVVRHRQTLREAVDLTLLYVDPPFVERAETVLGSKGLQRGHHRNADIALGTAHDRLVEAGIPHDTEILVGDPGPSIARFAAEGRHDLVIMGSHGHGAIAGVVLGSVVTKVLALCAVPVLVVR